MHESGLPTFQEYFLRPGYIYISRAPTLISTVLGSCVAVALWDKKRDYGGMNHFLYPAVRDPREATARYGNVAIKVLIRFFLDEGSSRENLEAQIFGGGYQPDGPVEMLEISLQNVAISRQILEKNGIPVVSEDVGGTKGRKVVFNSLSSEVAVFRVDRLRTGDWYPYAQSR